MKRNNKVIKMQFPLNFLSFLILLFSFSLVVVGQTEESDVSVPVVVPDQVMEQVVRRILVWNFKPRKQKKIIYLSEKGLQKSWLPEIEGIEFLLLSETEVAEKDGIHFFTELEKRSPSKYRIGFAYGKPSCYFEGANWYFCISNQKIRLWKPNEGFGGGCGVSSTDGYGSLILPQSNESMDVRGRLASYQRPSLNLELQVAVRATPSQLIKGKFPVWRILNSLSVKFTKTRQTAIS